MRALGDRIVETEPYTHNVPYSQRSGERIEPLISLQWFMRMDELAEPAMEVVRDGPRAHPPADAGAPLPRVAGEHPAVVHLPPAVVGPSDPRLVPRRGRGVLRADAAGGRRLGARSRRARHVVLVGAVAVRDARLAGARPPDLQAFYPTDVLSTARDILFLWVARMVMLGLRFPGDVPFTDVYIHSVIQAPDGRRMSKSLGTGIDPLDLIEGGPRPPVFTQGGEFPAYGADAVRFGLMAMASTQDVRFSEEKVAQGAQLTNKLFNASRLILMNAPDVGRAGRAADDGRGPLDPLAAAARQGRRRPRAWTRSTSPSSRSASTTSSSASCATGTSSSSSRGCTTATRTRRRPCCTCCARRSRWRTRSSRSSPRTSGRCAGTACSPRRRMPAVDDALVDEDGRAQVGLAIEAIRTLRNWRESVGVAPRIVVRGSLDSDDAARGRAAHRADGAVRVDRPTATSPRRPCRCRAASWASTRPRAWTSTPPGASATPSASAWRARSSGWPRSSPTRGSWPRRRPRSWRRSGPSSPTTRPSSRRL